MPENQTGVYKGKQYLVRWSGDTKYGKRTKLAFLDGSKEFWVSSSEVQKPSSNSEKPVTRTASSRSSGRCRECRGPIQDAPHHRAMGGLCGDCAFDEYDC